MGSATLIISLLLGILFLFFGRFRSNLKRYLTRRTAFLYHGCKEPPHYPHRDREGFDLARINRKASQQNSYLEVTAALFAQYGQTHKVRHFGKTMIRSSDPTIAKAIYSTHFEKFGVEPIRYEGGKGLFGNGILVTDGAHWNRSRALIRSTLDIAHIANFDRLSRHVDRFLEILPRHQPIVDLLPIFKRLTLDLSSEFIFGKSMDALSSPESCQEFLHAFMSAQRGVGMPEGDREKDWEDHCKHVLNFIDQKVDEAFCRIESGEAANSNGKYVRLIDEVAKETQDRHSLRYLVLSIFNQAHDSVAITLGNAFFHLARNPHVWKKLRVEIMSTASAPLTYQLLKSYQYLNWTFRETHRLTPVLPASQRQCLASTILPTGGGLDGKSPLFVEEGDLVETNFRVMQRSEDIWGKEAGEFRPERWAYIRPAWEYIPFSGGPRICPAFDLVYTECEYITARLVREFSRLENGDPYLEWVEEGRLIFQSKNGTIVRLIP